DCRNPEQCHPELTGSGPVCVGVCPDPNMSCNRIITDTPDGGIDVECRCEPCTPEKCDDGDPCTKDYCDALGNCVNEPINCDDGDPCTEDICVDGVCFHILKNCDDG